MLDDIKDLLARDPFESFRIVTTSGDKYTVRSASNVVLMKDRIFYAFPSREKWVFIRFSQITALESVSSKAA